MSEARAKTAGDTLAGVLSGAAERTRAKLSGPWIPPDAAPRRFWVWAVLLAVCWHTLGWVWLKPATPAVREERPPLARVEFRTVMPLQDPVRGPEDDVRGLWSPVLFALPTRLGFSRPVLEQELVLRPPVDTPGGDHFLLQRDAGRPSRSAVPLAPLAALFDRPLATGTPGGTGISVFTPPAPGSGYMPARLSSDFGARRELQIPLDAVDETTRRAGWEATAYVVLDEAGAVKYALLETPSPSAGLNAMLSRELYQCRFGARFADRRGRVFVHLPAVAGGEASSVREPAHD